MKAQLLFFCLIEGQCLVKQTQRHIIDENKRELFIFIVSHHNLQLNLFRSLFLASSQLWYCHLPVIKGIDQPTQNRRRKLFRYFLNNWVLPVNRFIAHFMVSVEKRHWTHFLFLFPLGLEPFTPTNLIHNGPELGANKSHQSARPEYVCHHIYPQWQKDITKMSQKLPNCSALLNIREFWGQKVAEPMQSPLSCICPRATLCRKQEDLKRTQKKQKSSFVSNCKYLSLWMYKCFRC